MTLDGAVSVSARPPGDDPARRTRWPASAGVVNAVFVEAEAAGQLMFYGRGAGGTRRPRARCSATVVAVARNPDRRRPGGPADQLRRRPRRGRWARLSPATTCRSRRVRPTPASAAVAAVFAEHDVSIADRPPGSGGRPSGARAGGRHRTPATDAALAATVQDLRGGCEIPVRDVTCRLMRGRRRRRDRTRPRPWRGLIEAYRDRLPVTDATPVVTLHEGNTPPLLPAPELSDRTGCDVYLKVEGANPTGSFKDRGMTVAVSKAVEEGDQGDHLRLHRQHLGLGRRLRRPGRHHLRRADPGRQDRPRQAGPGRGARRPRRCRWPDNFDDCLALASKLALDYPVALVNSVNLDRLHGQKTAAFEIVEALGDAPDIHCLPVGNAGNITAYWMGYKEDVDAGQLRRTPRMLGFQASGAARSCWAKSSANRRPSPPPSGSATRPRGPRRSTPGDASGGVGIRAVTDRRDPDRVPVARSRGRVFVELASAAYAAGLARRRDRRPRAARVHSGVYGHRPRPQGPGVGLLHRTAADRASPTTPFHRGPRARTRLTRPLRSPLIAPRRDQGAPRRRQVTASGWPSSTVRYVARTLSVLTRQRDFRFLFWLSWSCSAVTGLP